MAKRPSDLTCPQDLMRCFNLNSVPYWLENIRLIDGSTIQQADVISHGPHWIEIRPCTPDPNGPVRPAHWINLAHVVSFRLVEG
jgi:hypothetical protein